MTVIDVHCHAAPQDAPERLSQLHGVVLEGGQIVVGPDRFPFPPGLTSSEALADHLGPDGWAIISPPPALFLYGLERHASIEHTRSLNDGLLDLAKRQPRIRLLASLPLAYPEDAVEEVRRIAGAGPVFVGVTVGTDPCPLSDSAMDPLWKAVTDSDLGVFVHPNASCMPAAAGPRAGPAVGFPIATTVAVVTLLLSDSAVWDAGTRLCLAHGGGFLFAALARLRRALDDDTGSRLEARLRQIWVDGVLFDDDWARFIAGSVGEERVLPGSDWPFPLRVGDKEIGGPSPPAYEEIVDRVTAWCPRFAAPDTERRSL